MREVTRDSTGYTGKEREAPRRVEPGQKAKPPVKPLAKKTQDAALLAKARVKSAHTK